MEQIKYGDDAFALRLEMPPTWDIESITEVTIGIKHGTTELLAATAATQYTATTLNGALTPSGGTATIANDAGAVVEGDRLRIAASAAGPAEDIEVHSYDSSTKVITLRRELNDGHSDGTAVHGMWCTYSLDASDTDTWGKGYIVEVVWTPDSNDEAYTDRYVIGTTAFASSRLWRDIELMHPALWKRYSGHTPEDLSDLEGAIAARLEQEMWSSHMDLDRIRDMPIVAPILTQCAIMVLYSSGGDEHQTEYERARDTFHAQLEKLKANPIWIDYDQDGAIDDDEGEVQSRTPRFLTRIF